MARKVATMILAGLLSRTMMAVADEDPDNYGEMFSMNCGLLTRARVDPITHPGQELSPHVHVVSGSRGFGNDITAEDIMNANCTSCAIKEDMSVYWTANAYFAFANGSFAELNQNDPNSGLRVYYFARLGDEDGKSTDAEGNIIPQNLPKAFPPGLRMLAGNPQLGASGASPGQKAVTYSCYGQDINPKQNHWPIDLDCDEFIRAEIYFPYCWDGKNLDSDDHISHMSYGMDPYDPTKYDTSPGSSGGVCPPSHPVRTPAVFYERFFHTSPWNEMKSEALNKSQPFVFSHGDGTGYGFHGDFMSGWPQDTLQGVIDKCGAAIGVDKCSVITENTGSDTCKLDPPTDELTGGIGVVLAKLPGGQQVRYDGPSAEDAGSATQDDPDDTASSDRFQQSVVQNAATTASGEGAAETTGGQVTSSVAKDSTDGSSGLEVDGDASSVQCTAPGLLTILLLVGIVLGLHW